LGIIILPQGGSLAVVRIGEGAHGMVFRPFDRPDRIFKVAKTDESAESLSAEQSGHRKIIRSGIRVAKIFSPGVASPLFLEKEFIEGPSAAEIRDSEAYTSEMIEDLATKFVIAHQKTLYIDVFRAENFIWSRSEKTFVLVDSMLREFESLNRFNYVNFEEWGRAFFGRDTDLRRFKQKVREMMGPRAWRRFLESQKNASLANHALKYFEGF
jgi:hypothetical protein